MLQLATARATIFLAKDLPSSKHADVIEMLLAAGADSELRDEDGRIPFDLIPKYPPLKDARAYQR